MHLCSNASCFSDGTGHDEGNAFGSDLHLAGSTNVWIFGNVGLSVIEESSADAGAVGKGILIPRFGDGNSLSDSSKSKEFHFNFNKKYFL